MSKSARPNSQSATGSVPLKYLFVASTGGHLAQLVRFAERMNVSPESRWITFRTPQSESLLHGKHVTYVPYVKSRDYRGVLTAFCQVRREVHTGRYDEVISTGAALALAVFPAALLARVPRTYIESVSRIDGPSVTGRIIAFARLADLRTQHDRWSTRRWRRHPSVLSLFRSTPRSLVSHPAKLNLFVTLGTIKPYRFDSLIDAVLATGLASEATVWQVGVTDRTDLPGRVFEQVSTHDFDEFASNADVVITHAGVGSILTLLERGIYPVVVPRRRVRSEHVDDHQDQITRLVKDLEIAEAVEAPDLNASVLFSAMERQIVAV